MNQYQEFLNHPDSFIFILFIFYLIASLFFFTLTVFIGLKPVSFKEKNHNNTCFNTYFDTYFNGFVLRYHSLVVRYLCYLLFNKRVAFFKSI